jgi:hypothetical protein
MTTATETPTPDAIETEPFAYVTTRDLDDRLYEIDETLRTIYREYGTNLVGFLRALRESGYRMTKPRPRRARKATESLKYADYSMYLSTLEAPLTVRLDDGSTQTTWLECGLVAARFIIPALDDELLDAWEQMNAPRADGKPQRFWLYAQVSRRRRSRSDLGRDNIKLVRGRRSLLGRSRRIAEVA